MNMTNSVVFLHVLAYIIDRTEMLPTKTNTLDATPL